MDSYNGGGGGGADVGAGASISSDQAKLRQFIKVMN